MPFYCVLSFNNISSIQFLLLDISTIILGCVLWCVAVAIESLVMWITLYALSFVSSLLAFIMLNALLGSTICELSLCMCLNLGCDCQRDLLKYSTWRFLRYVSSNLCKLPLCQWLYYRDGLLYHSISCQSCSVNNELRPLKRGRTWGSTWELSKQRYQLSTQFLQALSMLAKEKHEQTISDMHMTTWEQC